MPWLPFYANADDATAVLSWLAKEEEIAFIVRTRPGWLTAVPQVESLADGRYCLWNVLSGPLPYYRLRRGLFGKRQVCETVLDPWAGWEETVTSATGEPWFGGGHAGIFWLNMQTQSVEKAGGIGLSGFEWIGSRWRPAPPCAAKWWKCVRKWMEQNSQKIDRRSGSGDKAFAMAGAHAAIASGAWCDVNAKIS